MFSMSNPLKYPLVVPYSSPEDALGDVDPTAVQPTVSNGVPTAPASVAPAASVPSMSAKPPVAPTASAPTMKVPSTSEQIQQHLQNRLMSDYQKDENPYGSANNHPGVFGKLLHGLNYLTGGVGARSLEENAIQTKLENMDSQKSLNAERDAETRKANADADKADEDNWITDDRFVGKNGEPVEYNRKTGEYRTAPTDSGITRYNPGKFQIHDTEAGPILFNTETLQAQHLTVDGAPVGPKLKLTQSQPIIGDDGKPHTYMLDDKGSKVVDLGVHYERPVNVSVNASQNEADKLGARLGKPYESASAQGQGKLDRIDQTLRSLNAGYVGQGLAIPELLTSLVSGAGTGVRITQPELNMITAHRGIKGQAESWFNSLAGKGHLTDTDKSQIRNILSDAKTRLTEKIQLMNDAQDAINGATARQQVVDADKKFRAIQLGMEKYVEIRRDDGGNYYGSNDGGKTVFDLSTGKEVKP